MKNISNGTEPSHISDHELIYCTLDSKVNNPPLETKTIRDFSKFDINDFKHDLANVDFCPILYFDSIDKKVAYLNECILLLFDKHAPYKTFRNKKPSLPYLTDNIKLLMSLRNKAYSKAKRTKNKAHWDYYKQLRNFTSLALQNERKAYFEHKFRLNSSKEFWHEINKLNINSKKQISPLPVHLRDPDKVNNFFIRSVNEIVESVRLPSNDIFNFYRNSEKPRVIDLLEFTLIDNEHISKIINSIKTTATGVDEINIKMIQLCCPTIIPYITHIINTCLMNSYSPSL